MNLNDPSGHIPACDKDDWDCQHHDYPIIPDNEDYTFDLGLSEDDVAAFDLVLEIGAPIVFEPVDWLMMYEDCSQGECSPLMLLGLLPLIPGSLGSKADDVVDLVMGLDGVKLPIDDTLDLAISYLGKNYIDMGNGRFLSADGLRQVRMGIGDILGTHPFSGGPHINFELLAPKPGNPGHFQIINDIHIFIYEVFK